MDRTSVSSCGVSLSLGLLIYLGTAGIASAENWPRFRGVNGAGIAPGNFSEPITDKDIAWKIDLPGVGHSSPIVWGDHVYVTSAPKESGKRYVMCVSALDGKTLWKKEYSFLSYREHRDNSYASSTPAADDLGVYVTWTTPQEATLLAFSHDGKERWKRSLGTFQSQHGSGSSPMIAGDLVILNDDQEGPGGALYAFDHATGQPRWKLAAHPANKAAMMTPTIWKPATGPEQLVIATFGGGVQGIDIKTGKPLWEATGFFFSRPIGSPQTTDSVVIAVNGEGQSKRELIGIKPGPPGEKPQILYKIDKLGPHVPSPLIMGDKMILLNDQGQLTKADVNTGKVSWSEKVGGAFYGSPILAGDCLWAINRGGELVGVNVANEYKPIGKLSLNEPSQATPAVADGKMYLRTFSHLICVKGH